VEASGVSRHAGIVAIRELTGVVQDIVGGSGIGHPVIVFIVGETTYTLKAAPYRFLVNVGVIDLIGEQVTILVAECRQGSYLALEIYSDPPVYLRDRTGKPLWPKWRVDANTAKGMLAPVVNAASVETLTVAVEDIAVSLVTEAAYMFVRHGSNREWIVLGPASLLTDQGCELRVGDRVKAMVTLRYNSRHRVALEIENSDTGERALLRTREGHQYRLSYP
jgi:hypothetical protein